MKGKVRNQRLSNARLRKQQHLLEVNVRAQTARVQRVRAIVRWTFWSLFFSGAGVGLWLGGKEVLRRFLWENPEYALAAIHVQTDGALLKEQVVEAAGLKLGVNIFSIDRKSARAKLDSLPQVERAELERVLPNRIEINIRERRPIAWVTQTAAENPTASDKSLLIDARGVVMTTKQMLPEYYHLPQISGVTVGNYEPGERISTIEMQSALELVRLNAGNIRWQARNIDLAKGYCLVVTDQNHGKITFGLDDVSGQLDRLFRYLDRAEAERRELRTVNLLVKKNTPVTFHDPPPEEAEKAPPAVAEKASEHEDKAPAKAAAAPAGRAATPVPRALPVNPTPAPAKAKAAARSKAAPTPVIRKPFRP
jgi:cell division septal protein FtsQ